MENLSERDVVVTEASLMPRAGSIIIKIIVFVRC